MVHRPTSYTVGESPSFLYVVGIIVAVIVGLVVFVCLALSFMVCCVLVCCPNVTKTSTSTTEAGRNRRSSFFTNLNPLTRREANGTLHPQGQVNLIPTAPPSSALEVPVNKNVWNQTSHQENPPSYAEVTMAMEKENPNK